MSQASITAFSCGWAGQACRSYLESAWCYLGALFCLLATAQACHAAETDANSPQVLQCLTTDRKTPDATIVITDMEPDDRFALHVLAHNPDAGELDLESGFAVSVEENNDGHIAIVESVHLDIYRKKKIEAVSLSITR